MPVVEGTIGIKIRVDSIELIAVRDAAGAEVRRQTGWEKRILCKPLAIKNEASDYQAGGLPP
jgi:hypothetical protein